MVSIFHISLRISKALPTCMGANCFSDFEKHFRLHSTRNVMIASQFGIPLFGLESKRLEFNATVLTLISDGCIHLYRKYVFR